MGSSTAPDLRKKFHDLVAGPSFGVDAGVDHQAYSAEQLGREAAIIGNWVLIEADLFAKLLGVQGPAFDVSVEAEAVQAKFGQAGELLLHRELHVMAGDAFVISDGFVVDQRAIGEVARWRPRRGRGACRPACR